MWLAVALLVAGLAAFANAIDLPFVFDDHGSIVENTNLRQLWPLRLALGAPVQSAVAGRPVVSLSLALNYWFGGLSPAVYHAWNLGVHMLAALLLLGIVRRTLLTPRLSQRYGRAAGGLAFTCALLWMVHPLETEVVDYVSQRTESMMGFFYLATLYAAIRAAAAERRRSLRWEIVAIASCALGMACKESMATAPVVVLIYDAVFLAGALKSRARLYTGLALSWVVLAALIVPGPRWRSAGFSSGVSPWTYLLDQPSMIVTYLRLAVWPVGQILDYGAPQVSKIASVLPYAVPVVLLIVGTIAAWRWRPELAFLGTWFFVTLAPTSSIVPIATEVGAERRMYLPLAALIVFAVCGAWAFVDRRNAARGSRWVTTMIVVALYGALTTLTIRRNAEYKSPAGIWQTVVDRRPNGRAHYSLAMELKAIGRRDEAIRHYRLALPDAPDAHYALGFELEADGKADEAIPHFREFLRLKPDDQNAPRAYVLLGRDLQATGRLDEAAESFRQAVRMRPRDVDSRAGLGSVLIGQRRYDEAVVVLQDLVGLDPGNAMAFTNLGIAFIGRDRADAAVTAFARAVELAPANPALHHNLGNALAGVGKLDEAVAEYRRALAIAPNEGSVHHALGRVLGALGRNSEAVEELRRAVALAPADGEIRADLAAMLRGR